MSDKNKKTKKGQMIKIINESDKGSRLAAHLGIREEDDPLVDFEKNPCPATLSRIAKPEQTDEMVRRAIAGEWNDWGILRYVSKKLMTSELCLLAVKKYGRDLLYVPKEFLDSSMYKAAVSSAGEVLAYVPEKLRDYEMCLLAVGNDSSRWPEDCALGYVPKRFMKGEKGRHLIQVALASNSFAIAMVPKQYITKKMVHDAIVNSAPRRHYGHVIEYVPSKFLSQELVELSVELFPESLEYIPLKYVSEALCLEVVKRNGLLLGLVPEKYQGRKAIIDAALYECPQALQFVPERMRTKTRCLDAIKRDPEVSVQWFPDKIRVEYESMERVPDITPLSLDTPKHPIDNSITVRENGQMIVHDLAIVEGASTQTIYYVTDIHLEHQLELQGKTLSEIKVLIKEKVSELVSSVSGDHGTLLVGGDISHSVELERIFYDALYKLWHGRVIAVLGNHELWDGHPMGTDQNRPIDEIIDNYRNVIKKERFFGPKGTLLENELLIVHKGQRQVVLDEKTLLEADTLELSQLCKESSFIVLGGIGFSGLNPYYNAATGLYRSTVSTQEDIERTNRFRAIYDKVLSCSASQTVIVLTHMPMRDWCSEDYNPNWIYVSGHTHQNALIRRDDGTTVLCDNQIGYKPKTWHLNGFTVTGSYDPFRDLSDGIYSITRQQYIDFNRGHGIHMQGFKQAGNLFVLKRDGIYMFVLQDKRLCLLEGGRKHALEKDIDYYYSNMPLYHQKINAAFAPYRAALDTISKEVKAFGGNGTIHGCIVDIDYFNHIYLNPYDGKITPYFAWDMTNKQVFNDVSALLTTSPAPAKLSDGTVMSEQYTKARSDGLVPILASQSNGEETALTTVPKVVLDRRMYKPSRIMRSIQYIFDQNVIRIWNEKILTINFEENSFDLEDSTASRLRLDDGKDN